MNGSSAGQHGHGVRGRTPSLGTLRARRMGRWLAPWLAFSPGTHAGRCRSAWLSLVLCCACHASVQADAKVGDDELDADIKSFDRPLAPPEVERQSQPPVQDDAIGGNYALLGARHDLGYSGPKSPSCACLAVALRDQAQDAAFQWELERPQIEPSSQWIIALSSNDVPCDAPPSGTLGASYQGYGLDGNDVVVYVEALGEGRPMTTGAIIPRPKPTGSVFVEPTNAVYGKPLEGNGKRCKLNAPGTAKP